MRPRLRRPMMITPGHRRERLKKAATLAADSLAFDSFVAMDLVPRMERLIAPAEEAAAIG